uniref:Solute carrier organic anion transporter family member n=1 Tax=Latimeria chalumnae TaxID=7897 RepID=H3ABP2_LATCH
FTSVQFFVVCHGVLQLSQLLVSGYLKSSVSTIEKRFGLSSKTSGMITSSNEIGNTLLIVFVSYFGSRVHRPRFIGCGAVLVCLAGFLMSLPHFIVGPYEFDNSIASSFNNATDTCWANRSSRAHGLVPTCGAGKVQEDSRVLFLLFSSQILLGIGGVPIQPFGISYVDDFASASNSPLYLGILFAITILGPGLAFMLGSVMLKFYVDIDKFSSDEIVLEAGDPRWVGAWWLGFLIASSIVAVSAVPYFFFPRKMPKEGCKKTPHKPVPAVKSREIRSETKKNKSLTLLEFIKKFPHILLRTLKNPIYLIVVMGQVNLSAMVAGLATFMAKFMERQFTITASFANLLIGGLIIPAAVMGVVVGGVIMKRLQLTVKQLGVMCSIALFCCLCVAAPLLFIGCATQKVAGITHHYNSSEKLKLSSQCNSLCFCEPEAFNPVCGSDGVEYISPCYAGCKVVNVEPLEKKVLNYTECSCISTTGTEGLASPGTCGSSCSHLLKTFVILVSVIAFVASLSQTPSFMMVLRSVPPEDKSFAIGIQFMILRVLAWMPGPVLYGTVIDTTCISWEKKCDKSAACRYYNNDAFRQRFLGLQFFFEVGAFLCFLTTLFIFRKQSTEEQPEKGTKEKFFARSPTPEQFTEETRKS